MRSIDAIIRDVNTLSFEDGYWSKMESLASEIEEHNEGAIAIEAVLRLFEQFPQQDFGSPGPLVHAIESYYQRGYEDQLVESLKRCPTEHTVWLARRIINAGDSNSERFERLVRNLRVE
jgi:hypothetical protein